MSAANDISVSGTEGSLPLLAKEREWKPRTLFFSSAQTAVATWCFLIGSYIAFYLPAGSGSIVMPAAMLVGMFFVWTATVPMATRYGLEATRSTRAIFGARGSRITVALIFLFTIGWGTTLMILSGKSAAYLAVAVGLVAEEFAWAVQMGVSVASLIVVWLFISRGAGILRRVGPIVAVSVILLGLMVIVVIVAKIGTDKLFSAVPQFASGNKLLDYTTGIELMLATALSWWPYVGGMSRFNKSTRRAIVPVVLGLGLSVAIICLIGLYTELVFPGSAGNPVQGLFEQGGLWIALPAFAFIIISNIGTTMVGTYTAALALKQEPRIDAKLSWKAATALAVACAVAVIVFAAEPFYENFGTFLTLSAVVFGPLCGLQITDYFLLRRQKLDIDGLYKDEPGSKYWYFGGFNLIGFASLAAGMVAFFLILDPITFESTEMFQFTTATVPATAITMAVYFILMKLVHGKSLSAR